MLYMYTISNQILNAVDERERIYRKMKNVLISYFYQLFNVFLCNEMKDSVDTASNETISPNAER